MLYPQHLNQCLVLGKSPLNTYWMSGSPSQSLCILSPDTYKEAECLYYIIFSSYGLVTWFLATLAVWICTSQLSLPFFSVKWKKSSFNHNPRGFKTSVVINGISKLKINSELDTLKSHMERVLILGQVTFANFADFNKIVSLIPPFLISTSCTLQ